MAASRWFKIITCLIFFWRCSSGYGHSHACSHDFTHKCKTVKLLCTHMLFAKIWENNRMMKLVSNEDSWKRVGGVWLTNLDQFELVLRWSWWSMGIYTHVHMAVFSNFEAYYDLDWDSISAYTCVHVNVFMVHWYEFHSFMTCGVFHSSYRCLCSYLNENPSAFLLW